MKRLKKVLFSEVESFYRTLNGNELADITGGASDCVYKCMSYISDKLGCSKTSNAFQWGYEHYYDSNGNLGPDSYGNTSQYFKEKFSTYGSVNNLSEAGIAKALTASAVIMAAFTSRNGQGDHAVVLERFAENGIDYEYYDPQQDKKGTLKASHVTYAIAATGCK